MAIAANLTILTEGNGSMDDFLLGLIARALSALSPVFLLALSWLSVQLSALITARIKNERIRAVLQRLDDAVFTAVREVEQVLVVSLKTASVDGTLGIVERAEVKAAAAKAVRAYMGTRGWLEVGVTLGLSNDELERMLAARVEAAVYDLRGHPARVMSNVLRAAFKSGDAAGNPPHASNGSA